MSGRENQAISGGEESVLDAELFSLLLKQYTGKKMKKGESVMVLRNMKVDQKACGMATLECYIRTLKNGMGVYKIEQWVGRFDEFPDTLCLISFPVDHSMRTYVSNSAATKTIERKYEFYKKTGDENGMRTYSLAYAATL